MEKQRINANFCFVWKRKRPMQPNNRHSPSKRGNFMETNFKSGNQRQSIRHNKLDFVNKSVKTYMKGQKVFFPLSNERVFLGSQTRDGLLRKMVWQTKVLVGGL